MAIRLCIRNNSLVVLLGPGTRADCSEQHYAPVNVVVSFNGTTPRATFEARCRCCRPRQESQTPLRVNAYEPHAFPMREKTLDLYGDNTYVLLYLYLASWSA